ncbi:MAG TPA: AraC family transcriptional regulator, partial [Bradyrhizobium sp.]|nr:AraC family transcriptional regulator [Bradyrhizobium sp.]
MTATTLLQRQSITVSDFRCSAGPDDTPFAEQHTCHSISYVRKGSFGCHSRGRFFELVAGSILVGHPGDEYVCTHDHVCGDECLSFFLTPELVEAIGDRAEIWQLGAAPPLPELMVLGELAQAAADGRSDIGLDEVGQAFASRFVEVISGQAREPVSAAVRDRRRAVE